MQLFYEWTNSNAGDRVQRNYIGTIENVAAVPVRGVASSIHAGTHALDGVSMGMDIHSHFERAITNNPLAGDYRAPAELQAGTFVPVPAGVAGEAPEVAEEDEEMEE